MLPQEAQYCRNPLCTHRGLANQGNIRLVRRYGKNGDKIEYRCRSCGKHFSSTRDTPMFGLHTDLETVRTVAALASEGVGVRKIAREVGISTNTVHRIIVRVGEHPQSDLAERLKGVDPPRDPD